MVVLERVSELSWAGARAARWALVVLSTSACALTASACAPRVPARMEPHVPVADQLRTAEGLTEAGCLDCLAAALAAYDQLVNDPLGNDPLVGATAQRRIVELAALVAAREHELGLEDSGALDQAKGALAHLPETEREALASAVEAIELLPGPSTPGAPTSEADLARRATANRRGDTIRARLAERVDVSAFDAYAWLSFRCAYRTTPDEPVAQLVSRVARWSATPLLAFRAATCRGSDAPALRGLLASDPRFLDVHYFIGSQQMFEGRVEDGIEAWKLAEAWRPRWPVLTLAMADAYLGIDEWEAALEHYERTLESVELPGALLGKARAQTYLERYDEALVTIDRLLALNGWFVGDAHYWRALNETQLERYPAAWADVERASALMVSGDVSKLAGIIAHRLGRSDVARVKFEEAWRRNRQDCEVGVHLSIVLSGQREWTPSLDALGRTATCLENAERQLTEELTRLRTSETPTSRQERDIRDREQRIATGRRLMATVWFNSAVASYYSARMDDARQFAERVQEDEEFGVAARTLLNRIP